MFAYFGLGIQEVVLLLLVALMTVGGVIGTVIALRMARSKSNP